MLTLDARDGKDGDSAHRLPRLLRIPRMLRSLRVLRFLACLSYCAAWTRHFYSVHNVLQRRHGRARLLYLALITLVLAHVVCCFWFFMHTVGHASLNGVPQPEANTWFGDTVVTQIWAYFLSSSRTHIGVGSQRPIEIIAIKLPNLVRAWYCQPVSCVQTYIAISGIVLGHNDTYNYGIW